MFLLIRCPHCGAESRTAIDKVPQGNLKTTCRKCANQFVLNKEQGINCVVPQQLHTGPVYAEEGWRVEHPACQGIQYRLSDLAPLIKSGWLTEETSVHPPGAERLLRAGEISQLQSLFRRQKEDMARAQRAGR